MGDYRLYLSAKTLVLVYVGTCWGRCLISRRTSYTGRLKTTRPLRFYRLRTGHFLTFYRFWHRVFYEHLFKRYALSLCLLQLTIHFCSAFCFTFCFTFCSALRKDFGL